MYLERRSLRNSRYWEATLSLTIQPAHINLHEGQGRRKRGWTILAFHTKTMCFFQCTAVSLGVCGHFFLSLGTYNIHPSMTRQNQRKSLSMFAFRTWLISRGNRHWSATRMLILAECFRCGFGVKKTELQKVPKFIRRMSGSITTSNVKTVHTLSSWVEFKGFFIQSLTFERWPS